MVLSGRTCRKVRAVRSEKHKDITPVLIHYAVCNTVCNVVSTLCTYIKLQ